MPEWLHYLFFPAEHPDITQSLIVIMMSIGVGVLVGRLHMGKVSLGVSAVLFTGLLFGHFGYRIDTQVLSFVRDFGLILFVYGIGIQVGPSFFSSFRKEGVRFNLLAIAVVLSGGIITYIIFKTANLEIENAVGVMSGAVTNTPGLGAAKATLHEVNAATPDVHYSDPAIAYAITYPIGVLGVILSIIFSVKFLRIKPEKEEEAFEKVNAIDAKQLIHKKCRILNHICFDKSIEELLNKLQLPELVISRLKKSGSQFVIAPSIETRLSEKDVLMLVGREKDVDAFIAYVGKESTDTFIESDHDVVTKNIFVTHKKAIHKNLAELDLHTKFGVRVTRVYRSGMELPAKSSLELFYGDKLRIVGNRDAVTRLEKMIGSPEKRLLEPDFLSLFGGLIIGIIIGTIPLYIPGLPVALKLGFAAGPLIAALLIGRYGGIGIIHSYFNTGAVYFMKDLGVCLFFAAVGVHAGENFYAYFMQYNGWQWIYYACFITFIPLMLMVVVGRFIMRINFLQLAGLMSGTYTDPAALAFSNDYFDSDIPAQAYATIYPLVTIFRIFIAQFLILLLI